MYGNNPRVTTINYNKRLGYVLAVFRELKELTQQKLADRLGVSVKTVRAWENGYNAVTMAALPHICRVLGITMAEFMHSVEFRAPEPLDPKEVAKIWQKEKVNEQD